MDQFLRSGLTSGMRGNDPKKASEAGSYSGHYLYNAILGQLYMEASDFEKARHFITAAGELTSSEPEKRLLNKKLSRSPDTGTTLGIIRNRVFVQTWRADDWTSEQADSVLSLFFEKDGKGGRLTMVHANIPDEHYPGIKTGWTTYYWARWKHCLATKGKRK